MIQIALLVLSILFLAIGIKGFTASGLKLSNSTTLKGRSGKVVGAICIAFGLAMVPLFVMVTRMFSS